MPTSYRGDVAWKPDSQTGLYELTRDDGSAVRLHDTYLRSVAYEAGPPSSLVLVFAAFDHYASDRFVLETTRLTLRFRATSVELLLR